MIKNLAFVFPGQGSQYIGMGKDFYESYDIAKDYFSITNKVLGKNLSDIIFNGTEEDLKQTEITQPAIYTVSCIISKILEQKNIIPAYLAGHSLGEYTALTAGNIFNFEDGINLVKKRGEFIKNACLQNKGGMIAVLGLEEENIRQYVADLSKKNIEVEIANYNSPGQIVLSYKGDELVLKEITDYFITNNAKRMIPLNVSGPFHSSFMKTASLELEYEISKYEINIPEIPVIFNYNAQPEFEVENIKNCIIKQVNNSVKWIDTINFMVKNGVDTIVEVGPGRVLSGLNKKIDRNLKIYNIDTIESLSNFEL
jgi:[acyl-carrier-protein] S-malonyltransferase